VNEDATLSLSNFMVRGVKAIIYRSDGCILLQQRDYAPGLLFPGCWTFFGGQVEADESLKDALQRELLEELGCVPGQVEDELFQWAWQGEKKPTQNYYFPVFAKSMMTRLNLMRDKPCPGFPLRDCKILT
jgi:ADP-ribose pyrophosphatase